MNLSGRLTVVMVSLVLLTATGIGFLSYRDVQAAILPAELNRLQANTLQRVAALHQYGAGARADILALSQAPALDAIRRSWQTGRDPADGTPLEVWKQRLAGLFAAEINAKPEYVEFRLIRPDGRELIRVDRSGPGGGARVALSNELKTTDRPFLHEALARRAGEISVSAVNLARDDEDKIPTPVEPVLRVAMPLADFKDQPIGVMAVNLDMRPAMKQLATGLREGARIYLVNEAGDFLLHPDASHSFGWQLGKRYRLQEEFPALAPWLAAKKPAIGEFSTPDGTATLGAMEFERLAGETLVGVLQVLPRATALAWGDVIGRSSFLAAALGVLLALGLAVFVARSLTRPLTDMADSLSRFTGDEPVAMPVGAAGEMGVLARAFQRMANSVRENTIALRREVAERGRAENEARELAERNQTYGAALESASDAIITTTLGGVINGWNPAAEQLFGFSAEEAIGRNISIIASPEQREEQVRNLARVGRGERILNLETTRTTKDGRLIDVAVTMSPVRSASGNIIGVSEIKRDLSARKAADERFRMAVDASPNAMIMVDEKGTIVLVNAEAERMFGYERGELIGEQIERLLPAHMRVSHQKNRDSYAVQPSRRSMGAGRDLFGVRKNGTQLAVEIGLNPIKTAEGTMVIAAVVDITERKRSEQLLAERARELERSNAELEQFAYVASHDLQEPLRMVASYTELLAERYQGQLDGKADKYIQYAVEGAKRMQRLVNDLLTYSRVGRTGGMARSTDLNRVVQDVLKGLQRAIEDAKAKVEVGKLPVLVVEEGQMAQVLQNLIGNALKFRAERQVTISVGAEPKTNGWLFHVRDNGIGIEQQYSDRIFQMFQRLHERGAYEGSGIGLTITKKIVERHGGRIWFESLPGEGTTFYFTLPISEEKAA